MEQIFHAVRLEVEPVAANAATTPAPSVPVPGAAADADLRPARAELSGFFFVITEVVNAEQAQRTGLKEGSETTNSVRFPAAPAVAKLLALAILDALDGTDVEEPRDPRERIEVVRGLPSPGVAPNRAQRRHPKRGAR